jgi:hypothetical protein
MRQQELKPNCCRPARIDSFNKISLLLAHMPKSDCLCNCAHKCIRHNMNDHQCEFLPVLKEEGIKSLSCRHCDPVLHTLLNKQFKPGLTATFINCNCLPQHCMTCTIKRDKPFTHWLVVSVIFVVQGLRPPELAIIHAIEQSKNLVLDENTNVMN